MRRHSSCLQSISEYPTRPPPLPLRRQRRPRERGAVEIDETQVYLTAAGVAVPIYGILMASIREKVKKANEVQYVNGGSYATDLKSGRIAAWLSPWIPLAIS